MIKKFTSGLCLLIMMSFAIGANAFPDATAKNATNFEVFILPVTHITYVPQLADALTLNYVPASVDNPVPVLMAVTVNVPCSLAVKFSNVPISPQLCNPIKYNIVANSYTSAAAVSDESPGLPSWQNKNRVCSDNKNSGESALAKYGGGNSPNTYRTYIS